MPLDHFGDGAPSWLAGRVDVGGFVGAASSAHGAAARHVGLQADVRLAAPERRLTPIVSLGAGVIQLVARRPCGTPALDAE